MIIGYFDFNDCDFAIEVKPEQAEQAKKDIIEGINAWYGAAHTEIEPTVNFTVDDIESFYGAGYAEPTEELLTKHNIDFKLIDLIYDNDGELITHVDEIL